MRGKGNGIEEPLTLTLTLTRGERMVACDLMLLNATLRKALERQRDFYTERDIERICANLEMLDDEDPELRVLAVDELVQLREPEVSAPVLLRCLDDPDERVRGAAVLALLRTAGDIERPRERGDLTPKAAAGFLLRAIRDPSRRVRDLAASVLAPWVVVGSRSAEAYRVIRDKWEGTTEQNDECYDQVDGVYDDFMEEMKALSGWRDRLLAALLAAPAPLGLERAVCHALGAPPTQVNAWLAEIDPTDSSPEVLVRVLLYLSRVRAESLPGELEDALLKRLVKLYPATFLSLRLIPHDQARSFQIRVASLELPPPEWIFDRIQAAALDESTQAIRIVVDLAEAGVAVPDALRARVRALAARPPSPAMLPSLLDAQLALEGLAAVREEVEKALDSREPLVRRWAVSVLARSPEVSETERLSMFARASYECDSSTAWEIFCGLATVAAGPVPRQLLASFAQHPNEDVRTEAVRRLEELGAPAAQRRR